MTLKNTIAFYSLLILSSLAARPCLIGQKVTEPFAFQFEQKSLRGLIEKPPHQNPSAMVLLIPGYGRTDFVEGNWYATLRDELTALGLAVCFWDKMGCGGSEGEFDPQQAVENSADEAIAAIRELRRRNVPGAEKIGLWGISRAGWIGPLINQQFPINFWISVSGTDDKENFGYLLRSNLIIAGKSEEEAEKLYQAWLKGHRLFCEQAGLEEYLDAIQPLREDSLCRARFGYTNTTDITEKDRQTYAQQQRSFTSKGYLDESSGLWVYIENFDEILGDINCPVLALFGADDAQVDWRKTKKLYEKTIGTNPGSSLSIKIFKNCNHNLQKCISCAYQEDLSALKWQACDGYFSAMAKWLSDHKIIE
jgi:hypothetical protein